jgi:hypothetical protein
MLLKQIEDSQGKGRGVQSNFLNSSTIIHNHILLKSGD